MGSPRLRFKDEDGKEFPLWVKRDLGNITDINPKNERLPEEFIYIDLESVKDGRLLNENKIRLENAPSRAQRFLKKNDILFQTVRPYQKNNLFFTKDGIYVASTGYAQIRTKENPRFIYQTLYTERFTNNVMIRCTGTSYPAIDARSLAEIKIYLPSLQEQTKIANFLSAIDDRISKIDKKLDLLKTYKKGMMQKIFSQEIRFKDENGEEFSEWKETTLGNVIHFINGRAYKQSEWEKEGVPVIRLQNLTRDQSEFYFSNLKLPEKQYCYRGDLLYMWSATMGPVWWKGGKAIYHYHIWKVIPATQEVNISFFYYVLLKMTNELFHKSNGSTMAHITKEGMEKENVFLPSLSEQIKIANFLSAIDEKITLVEKQLAATKAYKKGLMQQLFI